MNDLGILSVNVTPSGFQVGDSGKLWILQGKTSVGAYCWSRICGWNSDGNWTGFSTEEAAQEEARRVRAEILAEQPA